jgi:ribosomal protein S18 acetylase RimI-like enzyme
MFGVWDLFRLRSYFSLKTFVRLRFDLRNWQVSELVMPAELRIEHGRLEDLQRFRNRMSTAVFPDDFLADQIFGLSQFYLGLWGEEIAHILWVARSGETCSVSNLRLQSDAVEFRNVHTLERFRRRQIFGHVLRTALHDLRMAGVGTGFAHVNEHNLASLNGFKDAGFLPIERVVIFRIFGFRGFRFEPISNEADF